MKFLGHTSLLASIAFLFARGAWAEGDSSDVLDLTKDNFASTVDPESLILVEFFAPWCGHCKALAPQYETAATTLKEDNIKLAKVDCTVEEEVCAEQGIGGYPTLKVFRNGVSKEYSGPRKSDGIVSYMKKQALPAVSHVTTSNFSDFKGKDKVVVVAFLSESDKKDLDVFAKVADKHRDSFVFGHAADAAVASEAGTKTPSLIVYRSFDEPEVRYTGKLSDDAAIESFVREQSVPLIDEVGPDNFMTYAESGLPLAYYFTEPNYEHKDADIEKLKPLAKANKGKLNFVWIDAEKFINHAKGLNLQSEKWPAFAIQDIQATTKFPLDNLGSDAVKSITEFVEKWHKKEISPSIKSEPIPAEQDGPVHVLVADEFDQVMFDDKKDVFVEFYAPWCGHCKKLAPTFDSLGELYGSHKDKVTIAKMDATANDIPPSGGFLVSSFPTIKFKPAGSKEFIDYEGERTLDAFVDFIGTNGKNKVDVTLSPANETEKPAEEEHHAPKHEEL